MIILGLVIAALLGYIIFIQVLYSKKIDALMDRIMAKNLVEFKAVNGPTQELKSKSMSDEEEYKISCRKQGIVPKGIN